MAKRNDIYQTVTDMILDLLDQGTVPWKHPIKSSGGIPTSMSTGKPYRGINVFLLATTAMTKGYRSSHWLTFKQAQARGGKVRKGEKASLVVLWKQLTKEDPKTGEEKFMPLLRHYNVFNAEQCDGIEPPDVAPPDPLAERFTPIEQADAIVQGYKSGPAIHHGGFRACYSPMADAVQIAQPEDFRNREAYYSTLFHELVHSTGHSSRLDRGLDTELRRFGDPDYSKEELTAEMGAAFLDATAGIHSDEVFEQSAAYIENWRTKLSKDKKLIVQAAGLAQRAADRILGVTWDDEPADTPPKKLKQPGATAPPAAQASLIGPDLAATLQAFPVPGQANLCSTASFKERSAYIEAVLDWWNENQAGLTEAGVIDREKQPVVPTAPPAPAEQDLQARFDALGASIRSFPHGGGGPMSPPTTPQESRKLLASTLNWWNKNIETWTADAIIGRVDQAAGEPTRSHPQP